MPIKHLLRFALPALAIAALPLAASATTTLAGGAFIGSKTSAGVVGSAGPSLPIVPIAPQVSVAVPFNGGGRYAVTGEVRTTGSSFIGGGIGVGKLDPNGKTGTVFDGIAGGTDILPYTALVARVYSGASRGIGTNAFVGVQIGR